MDNGVKNKKKFDHIELNFEQMRAFHGIYERNKSKSDNVSWLKAFLVYMWIYVWQLHTKVGFGKVRKQDVFDKIGEDLTEPKPNIVVNALIRAGMVVWGKSEYNGVTNFCLQCTYLNEKTRNGKKNKEQAEDATIRVESSAKGDTNMGEYYQYGRRFYRDNNGDSYLLPDDAPSRPTPTALWNGKQWCEPEVGTFGYKEPEMSVGVFRDCGNYGYKDKDGNICKTYDGDILWIPKEFAFNRPSIEYVFDFEVERWCLPEDLTEIECAF